MDELCPKLSKLSIRNVNKNLKRRDNKIIENQCCMNNLTKESEDNSATIAQLENRLNCVSTARKRMLSQQG